MLKYTVYALCEPDSPNTVRYVGVTTGIRDRGNGHTTHARQGKPGPRNEWIRSLLREGKKPLVRTLETIETDRRVVALNAEKKWIAYFNQKGGAVLTNLRRSDKQKEVLEPAPHADEYTMTAAAALLDVDVSTLRRWCEKSGILPAKGESNKRSHFLTWEQIEALAKKQGRRIAALDMERQKQIAALQGRIEALERSASSASALSALLQEVLQRIEALERQPAPLDRSMRPGQPDQAPRPVAPAMSPSIDATSPTSAPRSASSAPASPPCSIDAPGASMERRSAAPLPPPVRALVAQWIADHGGPAKDTVRRWLDMPLEPAAALRYTQQKIAELGYRAHGAQLTRCQQEQCICWQVLPE